MNNRNEKKRDTVNRPAGAFLLRYWQENDNSSMRFMLRSVGTDERELFRDMESMLMRLNEIFSVEDGQ